MVESMMVEGPSVMKEINSIFILRDLHTPSEDHDDDPYVWWRTALGQRLEKVLPGVVLGRPLKQSTIILDLVLVSVPRRLARRPERT